MNENVLLEPQEVREDRRPATILIIDDDVDQAEVLAYHLKHLGFEVQHSISATQGQRLAQELMPDLIILDIRLPDGNGLELSGELSDAPDTAGIPVFIVSGAEIPQVVRKARAAGSRYYVRKPYDPNVLLLLIEKVLQGLD